VRIKRFEPGDPGYDALRDFAPVTKPTEMAFILVVHPSLPAKTMKELETLAKRNPGQLTFASTSAGPQMAGELFRLWTLRAARARAGVNCRRACRAGSAPFRRKRHQHQARPKEPAPDSVRKNS